MKLTFKPVNDDNRKAVENLKVGAAQLTYIESVEQCLKEADDDKRWHPLAIHDEEMLIGFAMYGFFDEYLPDGRVWLDRLMIDIHHQNHGYGKSALIALLDMLAETYPQRDIYLSVTPDNNVATKLYTQLGFHFINEKDVHNEDVMVKKFR